MATTQGVGAQLTNADGNNEQERIFRGPGSGKLPLIEAQQTSLLLPCGQGTAIWRIFGLFEIKT